MNHTLERKYRIALEHLAERMTFDQLGARHGISRQRAHQIVVEVYAHLGCSGTPTATDIGLAIQRRIENSTRDSGLYGSPEWFHRKLQMEREEDRRRMYFQP